MSVYWMSSSDWAAQDDYDDYYRSSYDDAVKDFYSKVQVIRQRFEWMIDEDTDSIKLVDRKKVNQGIHDIKALSDYTYSAQIGDDREVDIDYDFSNEVHEELVELGVE